MLLTLYRFITLCCGLFVCQSIRCLCVTKLPDRGDGILDCSQHCIIRLPSALPLRRNRYGVRAYCKVPKHTSMYCDKKFYIFLFLFTFKFYVAGGFPIVAVPGGYFQPPSELHYGFTPSFIHIFVLKLQMVTVSQLPMSAIPLSLLLHLSQKAWSLAPLLRPFVRESPVLGMAAWRANHTASPILFCIPLQKTFDQQ